MEFPTYTELLFREILKAKTAEKLRYLEDDIDIGMGLGDIKTWQDKCLLLNALQTRYFYVLFNDILTELETLNQTSGLKDKFSNQVAEIESRHLKLI